MTRIAQIMFVFLATSLFGFPGTTTRADTLFSNTIQVGIERFACGQKQWDGDLLQQAFTQFEQAADEAPDSFSANYLKGLSAFYLVLFHQDHNHDLASAYRSIAMDSLSRATQLDGALPEPYAILAVLTGMQIAEAPLTAIWRGRKAGRYQDEALQRDPENARSFYLAGVSYFKAPAPFGSDKKALANLLRAEALFQKDLESEETNHTPETVFTDWGYDHCLLFLGHVFRKQGHQAKANEYYHKAIAVNPGLRVHLIEFMKE